MNKKSGQVIENKALPDWFWVGDKWQVVKQDGRYRVTDVAKGGPDKPMTQRETQFLQALYSVQQHEKERWATAEEIVGLAIAPGADSSGNNHAQYFARLRKLFSKEIIKTRSGRTDSAQPTLYQLVPTIRPVKEGREDEHNETTERPPFSRYALIIVAVFTLLLSLFIAIRQMDEGTTQLSTVSYELSMRYARGDDETEYLFEQGQTLLSGDRLRLTLRPTEAAYLYLFYIDASKVAHVLFPPAQLDGLPRNYQNPLDAGFSLHLPSRETAYRLDEQSGYDTLTIIATNQAVPQFSDLDQINPHPAGVDSNNPGTLTKLSRPALEQRLAEVRHQFAQRCPDCIRSIEIVHR